MTILFWGITYSVWCQSESLLNQWRFLQHENPSFLGYNNTNKAGVLFNRVRVSESDQRTQQYLFGSISFFNQSFSLGFDLDNYTLENSNYKINIPKLAFVYILQFNQRTYILPALSVRYWNKNTQLSNLIFEDQISAVSNAILPETNDPLGIRLTASNYMDIGASVFFHTDQYFWGIALTQLNQPNTSLDSENIIKGKIKMSLQAGGEWDINRFQRGILPKESYFFLLGNLKVNENSHALNLAQEFQFGEFSIGIIERMTYKENLNINGAGLSLGLALENFDFGMQYYFPFKNPTQSFSPSIFELFLIF